MPYRLQHCIFCGSTGSLTKEDAWPVWVRDRLPDHRRDRVRFSLADGYTAPYTSSGPLTILKCVCRDCNRGWMGGLEGEAAQLFTPMMKGETTFLSVERQALMSFWAVKTSMTLAACARTPYVPLEQYPRLRNISSSRTLPPRTYVWTGRFLGDNSWMWDHQYIVRRDQLAPAVRVILIMGQLLFVTLIFTGDRYDLSYWPLLPGRFREHLIRLGPAPTEGAAWPPRRALSTDNRAELAAFRTPAGTLDIHPPFPHEVRGRVSKRKKPRIR